MQALIDLFKGMVERGASDLHLQEGTHPYYRVNGILYLYEEGPLIDHWFMEEARKYLFGEYENSRFDQRKCADFAHVIPNVGRLRVSFFTQSSKWGAVFRLIPEILPSFEELGLPEIIRTIARFPRGLVLVVGPTGSGKTTTLATMLDWINNNRNLHILTLEDPIEYKHVNINCIVNQREVGRDVMSFLDGIREGLRQDPDVILVGEMRDLETTAMALTAAETGHLVFATLHTSGAADTIDRIIDIFPANQQPQIRTQVALSLRAVISQVLVRRKDREGRVAIFEVMLMTNSIRNLIRESKVHQIDHVIQSGRKQGMITLEHNISQMIEQGIIDTNVGIELANDPDDLLEFLLEDAAKDRRRREREAAVERRRRQDFRQVGYDVGAAARRERERRDQETPSSEPEPKQESG
jgi:twitching motility protein PilT